jgi:hypothetical protein
MSARITSHFKRLYAPRINLQNINWPTHPDYVDEYPAIFSGDTAYIGARFKQKPVGEVTINATYDEGRAIGWTCGLSDKPYDRNVESETSVLARTIAARQMTKSGKDVSLKLAIDYQLLTEQTACYVEVKLAENQQSDGQPAIRNVPGMMASGYGGLNEVFCEQSFDAYEIADKEESMEYLDIPAFLRSSDDFDIETEKSVIADDIQLSANELSESHLILARAEKFYNKNNLLPINKVELLQCGLGEKLIDELLLGLSTEKEISHAIALFLYEQLQCSLEIVSKNFSREIRVRAKDEE